MATLARIAVARSDRSWTSTRDLVRFVEHAEERQPQVAHVEVAEHRRDVPRDPLALDERDDRHGVVEQVAEHLRGERHQVVGGDPHRHPRAERRADARPADGVDLDAELDQCPPDAEVGEAASPASTEHQAGGVARHQPSQAAEIARRSGPQLGHPVEAELIGDRCGAPRPVGISGLEQRQPALDLGPEGRRSRGCAGRGAARRRRDPPT